MMRKILFAAILVLIVPTGSALSAESPDLVVDSRFVNEKLGKPGWVILDVRTGDEYKGGHIPGAVNLGNMAADSLRDPTHRAYTVIPGIEKTLGEAGLSDDKHIIVYGNAADVLRNRRYVLDSGISGMQQSSVSLYCSLF